MALPVPRRALRSLLIFLVLPTLGLTLLIVIVTSSSSDAGGHGADAGEKLAAAAAAGEGAAAARGAGLRSRLGKSAGAVVGRLSDGVRRSRSGGGGSSSGAGRLRAGGVDAEGPSDAGAGAGSNRKGKKGKGKSQATRPRWAADPAAAAARRPALDHDRLDDQDDVNQRYFGKPPPPPLTDDDKRDSASGPHAGHHVRPANELDPATNTLTSASLLLSSSSSSSLGLATHSRLPSGLLVVDPKGRHPIYDLIAASHAAWDAKRARASKTLKQASKEYRRRYGRRPPKGFDRWWAYVKKHHVQLPDEYDQIVSAAPNAPPLV